jgi:NAD(P)-dependent dehydrogenase (short-subunit alcohol dehydrogenase family)
MKLPEELQYIQNSLKPQKSTDARMDGKVCVISGTTSGVGYQAAKRLAQGGAHLVMINRNKEKGLKLQAELTDNYGVEVDLFIADFQKLAEVHRAALEIRGKYPQVHVLINNAGVFNKRRQWTPNGHEMTFGVIHLASFLLTRLLIGNLQHGAPSRVLYVSSEAHRFGGFSIKDPNWHKRPYVGLLAYGGAKIAQIHTASVFAERLAEGGVTFNVMHPGAVRTNIGMNNGFFYRIYSRYILHWFLKDPASSGEAIYYLAADPGLEGVTGRFFNQTIEEKHARYAVKPEMSEAVWQQSEEFVQPYLDEAL